MVLIHGIGSRWQVFEPIIDLLALHHDVISVDLPGFVTAFAPVGFWRAPGRIWCQTMLSTMRWVSAYARPLVERMCRTQSGRAILLSGFYGHPALVSADVAIADVRALVGATMFAEARREFARYRVVRDQVGVFVTAGTFRSMTTQNCVHASC
jgi:pimeloyl-ACP methyl ester carboxylesterase